VRRWQALHKLVDLIAGLVILHFFWMRAAKNNFAEVFVYAAILAVLLGWRLREFLRKRRSAGSVPAGATGPRPSR
jgi:sulfoxide reductase heme-binding subunit YedZ